jgi:hypothetical protein
MRGGDVGEAFFFLLLTYENTLLNLGKNKWLLKLIFKKGKSF